MRLEIGERPTEPIEPLDDYRLKVLRASSRGTVYPYELTGLLAGPDGSFTEHDLDGDGNLVPVGPAPRPEHRRAGGRRGQHADQAAPGRGAAASCCSATRPSRSARCPSRSARG